MLSKGPDGGNEHTPQQREQTTLPAGRNPGALGRRHLPAPGLSADLPLRRFRARAQHQQQRTTEVAAKRGVIYDRAGRELAMSVAVDSVFAVPAEIPDLAGTISLVARITKD